ncbi:T9SS type A sorting domain-containing protein [Cognatitamlana onchidii]|uniref:T9SS type A sorting domain-containing protein n=1 Tax=Cognatitamlana onchidii TaxID=2562860 RepID=UPI0010A5FF7D|nr:T9SS type A sorting domain-containing protein [Algibacter onchidii]
MKQVYFFILCPLLLFSQIQIGDDIDGELTIAGDNSGRSISFSADGSVVAIGAPNNDGNGLNSGHVRIYKNINDSWVQVGSDIDGEARGDNFSEVSLSSDGNVVAIGASSNNGNGSNSGHIRVYKNINDSWVQVGNDIDGESAGDGFGVSLSLSSNGDIVAVGAYFNDGNGENSGHARIYKNINDSWVQVGSDIDGEAVDDLSGWTVCLSSDGGIVAIGAPSNDGNGSNSGHVRIYKNINDSWVQIGNDIDGEGVGDNSGRNVSLSSNGNIVAIGAYFNNGNGLDSGHVRVYKNVNDSWVQVGSDIDGEAEGDFFGSSVSLSSDGGIVAIGAILNDGNGSNSGHVRIYKNINDSWVQIGSDIDGEAAGDQSGEAVSLSADGSMVAIGAFLNDGNGFNSGHVRIYKNVSDVWTQVGSDIDGGEPIGGSSGQSVSLSADGNIVAIGARLNNGSEERAGHVRVLENVSGIWTQIGDDIDGEARLDESGYSIDLSPDGNVVAIGAVRNDGNGISSGHTRVFENVSGIWTQIGEDIDGQARGDLFGYSVGLSSDGNIVAIGAAQNDDNGSSSGHVRVFENVLGSWIQIGNNIPGKGAGDRFGIRLSLASNGNVVAVSSEFNNGNPTSSAYVRIFENISGTWTQIGNDIEGESANERFGFGLSLSSNGNVVAISAPFSDVNGGDSGYVKVYKNISNVWTQIGTDINDAITGDFFGRSVSLSSDGSIIAIGAAGIDSNGATTGHVKIYRNISNVWTQVGTSINGEAEGDLSGSSVSLSSDGSIVAIGAPGNDGNAIDSGHVRVYNLSAVLSTQSFEKDYFSYYPNPVKDFLNININKGLELKQVNIYNLQSQYLYSVKSSKIDVSNLSSGFYFIEVVTNEGKSAKKIIID